MRTVASLARVRSETRRRRDFSQERSIKIKNQVCCFLRVLNSFIDDSHPSLCTVFLPTPMEIGINTTEFYHPHRTVRSEMVKRSDLGY